MEAVIKGAKTVLSYSQPGDSILLLVDSKVVFSWLKQLFNDEKVSVSGLYAVLVDRRLNIIKALFEDRNVTVEWIASELNPADCLTRLPDGWNVKYTSAALSLGSPLKRPSSGC